MLLNKTVEPVPEMAFASAEITLYLSGNTSGNCIGLNVAALAESSQIDHAMLAQVSAGRSSVLDGQSSGIDGLPAGSCKSLVRLIGLRKYVGIMLLSSSQACGRGDFIADTRTAMGR